MSRTQTGTEKSTYLLLSLHGAVLYLLLFLVPVVLGVYYSMTDWNGIGANYNFVALENYVRIARDGRVLNALSINGIYTLVFVTVVNVLAVALALLLNDDRLRFRRAFRAVYFFPAVLAMVVVGLIFDQVFYHAIPSVGRSLGIVALERNLLGRPETALWGVLCVSVWRNTAVPMVLILAGLQTVPSDLIEAAILDGANGRQRFVNVIFPFLVPSLTMTLVLTVKHGLMVFDVIMATTDGGPGRATEVIGLLVYNMGFNEMRFGYASALSFVLFGLIAVISFVQIAALKTKEVGQI